MSLIIGIVGEPLSGKDTVGEYLRDTHGFKVITLSNMLREYIQEHHLGEPTRDVLQRVGNALRAEHGPDYLIRRALAEPAEQVVISGIRNLGELATFKKAGGILVAVHASLEVRYARAQARARAEDKVSFAVFQEQETSERNSQAAHEMQVGEVMKAADYQIMNDQGLKELSAAVEELLKEIGKR